MTIDKDAVNLIICCAYKEKDLLLHSSHCITISAMAIEIRCKKQLESFDDIFYLISPAELKEEVSKCSETLYSKVMKYDYFIGFTPRPAVLITATD